MALPFTSPPGSGGIRMNRLLVTVLLPRGVLRLKLYQTSVFLVGKLPLLFIKGT